MGAHDVTPNRSVLLQLKSKIKLTQGGHKVLKMKRDGLIIEFFEVMEKAKKMRAGVSSDYDSAMEKIRIATVREYDFDEVCKAVDELVEISKKYDNMETVRKMKEIVPEYKSNNSVYEVLDK